MNLFKSIDEIGAVKTQRKEQTTNETEKFYDPERSAGEPIPNTEIKEPNSSQPKQETPVTKLDPERAKRSGVANAYLVSGGFEILFSAIELIRHSRSMTDEEKIILVSSRDKDESEWTKKDRAINKRFLALSEKHNKIKDSIKITDKELEMLEYGFSMYAEATGKEASPSIIIWGCLSRFVGTKLMDMFL